MPRTKEALRELPPPDEAARAHSERLAHVIAEEIAAAGGRLDFGRFMELALYAPGLGYYTGGSRKFGAEGDFVTAPEISPLFSRCLARQCAEVLAQVPGGDLLEFGAGSGAMAAELLAELERLGSLPERYLILELSPELRERQDELIRVRVPHLAGRVEWLERLPEAFRGVVLANEVLDAMPVQRIRIEQDAVRQLFVAAAPEGGFAWLAAPPEDARLAARAEALREAFGLTEGYETEVGLRAEDWLRTLDGFLEQGMALLIDYGFPAREYYHPERRGGTLMCHYRHRAHPDPLILVGLQDITAHVDFTAVAEAAHGAGLRVLGYTNQANFLLGNGLAELAVSPSDDPKAQWELAAQVRRLTLPGEMGELFKVLAVGRGVDGPFGGFALRDDRGRL